MDEGAPETVEELGEYTRHAPPSARFGFELAALNLTASLRQGALTELFCPRPAKAVRLSPLLMEVGEAVGLAGAGYSCAKLKVGRRGVEEDARTIRVASRELGGIPLRLDANRAWSTGEAEDFSGLIEGIPVEYIEEPLSDPTGLAGLARRTGFPLALDETLTEIGENGLALHQYAAAIVLKPTLLGLARSVALAREARRLGMKTVVSSAYESGVGTLGLLAFAAALEDSPPAGLDTYRRLRGDVLSPVLDLCGPVVEVETAIREKRGMNRNLLEILYERS